MEKLVEQKLVEIISFCGIISKKLATYFRKRCSKTHDQITIVIYLLVIFFCYQLYILSKVSHHSKNELMNISENKTFDSRYIKNVKEIIYVYSAYRVSNSTIRIVTIKLVNERKKHLYFYYNDTWRRVQLHCNLDRCNMFYSPKCHIKDYIGVINILQPNDTINYLYLNNERNDTNAIKVPVKDVRIGPNHKFRHKLGMCVQAIFISADWASYVQFFEMWINQGVTKFYIYRQSNTDDVEKIFKLYNSSSDVEVEIVEWSTLPYFVHLNNRTLNPNTYLLRLAGLLSVFDCMHRAKNEVLFMAETDVDEVIYPLNGMKLVDYMEAKLNAHPSLASILFLSRRIRTKNNWYNATHPNQLDFDYLANVEEENHLYKIHYTKMVHIPHRSRSFHHHFGRETEFSPDRTVYEHLEADPSEAVVLHFRKYEGRSAVNKWKGSNESGLLSSIVPELNKDYKKRLAQLDPQELNVTPDWALTATMVNEIGERCALQPEPGRICYSASPCIEAALALNPTSNKWVVAKNIWQTV